MKHNGGNSQQSGVPKFEMRLGPDQDGSALAAYRQNIELLYRLDLSADAAANFYSYALTYQLPRAVLARVESVAQSLTRGPDEIARGGDQIVLYAQVRGELEGSYARRPRSLRPGDVAIIDYSREIVSQVTDFEIFYLLVPRDSVPPALLTPDVHGTVFPATSGPGRLLYGMMENLLGAIDGLTVAEADAAVDALLKMAAGSLQEALARASGASGDPQLDRALAFIDQHLARADLSPAVMCTGLAVSRSSLYRLFAPLGGVYHVILQRRLERAMKALLNGRSSRTPLRRIASSHGFESEEQFSRAFRSRFGVTPTRFYDLVRRKDHAALRAQAERAGFANLQAWIEAFPETVSN